tara:strand:- start:206 stop:376 length:171 start_codon:yes stop_codon:yes gene_type:complete
MQNKEKLFEMWRVYFGAGKKLWRVVKYNNEGVITMDRTFHSKKSAKEYIKELMSSD